MRCIEPVLWELAWRDPVFWGVWAHSRYAPTHPKIRPLPRQFLETLGVVGTQVHVDESPSVFAGEGVEDGPGHQGRGHDEERGGYLSKVQEMKR